MSETAASPHFPCRSCEVRDKAICAALDDDELRHLNAISTAVALQPRQAVFYEGDEGAYLFNVVKGAVRLSKSLPDGRRQITGFLFPGDFVGLAIANRYAYTAEAISDVSLCRFRRTQLTAFAERFPKLERRLLDLASNELAQAQDHLLILGQKKAAERVATVLVRLAERTGTRGGAGIDLELAFTREDFADYAGLTLETVSRQMSRLREQGLIDARTARDLHIPDLDALRAISGDV